MMMAFQCGMVAQRGLLSETKSAIANREEIPGRHRLVGTGKMEFQQD